MRERLQSNQSHVLSLTKYKTIKLFGHFYFQSSLYSWFIPHPTSWFPCVLFKGHKVELTNFDKLYLVTFDCFYFLLFFSLKMISTCFSYIAFQTLKTQIFKFKKGCWCFHIDWITFKSIYIYCIFLLQQMSMRIWISDLKERGTC